MRHQALNNRYTNVLTQRVPFRTVGVIKILPRIAGQPSRSVRASERRLRGRRLRVSLRSPAAVNPAAVQRYRAEMTMPATVTTRSVSPVWRTQFRGCDGGRRGNPRVEVVTRPRGPFNAAVSAGRQSP